MYGGSMTRGTHMLIMLGILLATIFTCIAGGEVVKGRVVYNGKDYGPRPGVSAYQMAVTDEVRRLVADGSIPRGTDAQYGFFGRCYCFQKRIMPNVGKLDVTTRIVEASKSCKPHIRLPDKSGAVTTLFRFGYLADETLCPDGFENPVTTYPPTPLH